MSDAAPLPLLVGQALTGVVALERLVELVVSRRNERRSRARGAVEHGRGHYPVMVALHLALLVGCAAEPALRGAGAPAWLGLSGLAVVLGAQLLRWWCIASLGDRWCTRVLVVPGLPLVQVGPYRWLRHPNYVAVVVEGAALPLACGAWATAAAFTAANALLLTVRIRCEDQALSSS
jgi:methyltransferase